MADAKLVHPKLIQIMPASRVVAVFGNASGEGEHTVRVEAWGLYDNGSTEALIGDADGHLGPAIDYEGFVRLGDSDG